MIIFKTKQQTRKIVVDYDEFEVGGRGTLHSVNVTQRNEQVVVWVYWQNVIIIIIIIIIIIVVVLRPFFSFFYDLLLSVSVTAEHCLVLLKTSHSTSK